MKATEPLAAATIVGAVHLTVADLDRSVAFYERVLGLRAGKRDAGTVSLGAPGAELLVLTEEPGAVPVSGHTGLFHFAVLLPERADLARWLVHAADAQTPLTGLSDHFVSEAIYLRDPDGHGIEIYADRPRGDWRYEPDGSLQLGTVPLDTTALVAVLGPGGVDLPYDGMPPGTRMGHVHLHVAELEPAEAFYRDVLGFDVTVSYPGQATFLSAGGYHHHLACNVWAGRGATPPPPGSAALRMATILLPDSAERDRVAARVADSGQEPVAVERGILVRDPSQNPLLLAV
jgi:catechol 2,3-dioxygenase